MGGAVPLLAVRLHPPPFKPCMRIYRTRLNGGLHGQLAQLWVTYRSEHPVQAQIPKPLPRPGLGAARSQVTPVALHQEAVKALVYVLVELVELPRGVPGAEVLSPAAQYGVQVADDDPDVLHPVAAPIREVVDLRPHSLHALRRGPPLQIVPTVAGLLQQAPRHAFVQVTAQKVEASLPSVRTTFRVFSGCSVSFNRSKMMRTLRSASSTALGVLHRTTR